MVPTLPRSKKADVTAEQLHEVNEAFNLFDSDSDGQLDYYEFKVAMKALGFEVPKSEVLQLLKQYSRGDSQRVTQSDFITIMTEKIRQRDPMDEIHKAFKLFDENGNGRITVGDLRRVAQELGESPNDEELQAMIDEFDMDNDGAINEKEFVSIMRGD